MIPVAVAVAGPLLGIHRTEVKDRIERAISTFSQSNPFGHFLTITVLVLVAVVLARSGRIRIGALLALVPVGLALALDLHPAGLGGGRRRACSSCSGWPASAAWCPR